MVNDSRDVHVRRRCGVYNNADWYALLTLLTLPHFTLTFMHEWG